MKQPTPQTDRSLVGITASLQPRAPRGRGVLHHLLGKFVALCSITQPGLDSNTYRAALVGFVTTDFAPKYPQGVCKADRRDDSN